MIGRGSSGIRRGVVGSWNDLSTSIFLVEHPIIQLFSGLSLEELDESLLGNMFLV